MFLGILLADETGLDVRFRHALGRMAELGHDQLGRIGIDHVGDLVHRALLHQELDEVDGALRHAVRKLLDRDGFRNDDFTHDFVPGLLNAHGLQLLALALALERSKRPFALLLVEGVIDGELTALALLVDDGRLDGHANELAAALDGAALVVIGRRDRNGTRADIAHELRRLGARTVAGRRRSGRTRQIDLHGPTACAGSKARIVARRTRALLLRTAGAM